MCCVVQGGHGHRCVVGSLRLFRRTVQSGGASWLVAAVYGAPTQKGRAEAGPNASLSASAHTWDGGPACSPSRVILSFHRDVPTMSGRSSMTSSHDPICFLPSAVAAEQATAADLHRSRLDWQLQGGQEGRLGLPSRCSLGRAQCGERAQRAPRAAPPGRRRRRWAGRGRRRRRRSEANVPVDRRCQSARGFGLCGGSPQGVVPRCARWVPRR